MDLILSDLVYLKHILFVKSELYCHIASVLVFSKPQASGNRLQKNTLMNIVSANQILNCVCFYQALKCLKFY